MKKKKKPNIIADVKKYVYASIIFALMMTMCNFLFMLMSLYSNNINGLYIWFFDDIIFNIILNTIIDVIFFFTTFIVYAYLIIEMLIFPKEIKPKKKKKR